jgi:hypothetical protein
MLNLEFEAREYPGSEGVDIRALSSACNFSWRNVQSGLSDGFNQSFHISDEIIFWGRSGEGVQGNFLSKKFFSDLHRGVLLKEFFVSRVSIVVVLHVFPGDVRCSIMIKLLDGNSLKSSFLSLLFRLMLGPDVFQNHRDEEEWCVNKEEIKK